MQTHLLVKMSISIIFTLPVHVYLGQTTDAFVAAIQYHKMQTKHSQKFGTSLKDR